MSVYNLNRNPIIQTSSNTYIPVSFEDKENVFDAVNMSLNGSSRHEQGKVPRLEISRTRSFSRQSSPNSSFRTQTENEANNTLLHYTNSLQQHLNTQMSSVSRDYAKKQIPIPKPQNLPQAPSSRSNYSVKDIVNGTQNNLYNYAYQPQRTKRSLSGQIYQSPSYENIQQKQYFPDYSLEYSCNFSSNGGNYGLPQDSILNESRAVISKETDNCIQDYKEKMKELSKFFDENKAFEQEVQSNLKNLQYLGQRKQDIISDCIKDLDDLYFKYKKESKYDDTANPVVEITDVSTQNYITQQKNEVSNQDIINCHSSQYDFSDFQDRKSVQIIEGDYSISYKSQSQCDIINQQPSVNDFDS